MTAAAKAVLRAVLISLPLISACSPSLVALPVASRFDPEPVCGGPALQTIVRGRPNDSGHPIWAERNGQAYAIEWPPGFTARFAPQLEVLDRTGAVLVREGQDLLLVGDAGYEIACPVGSVIRIFEVAGSSEGAPKSDDDRAVSFRQEFGLASDLATVRRIATDPSSSLEYGVPLSPAEVAELVRREAITSQLEPLSAALEKDPRFGGMYVVQSEGGRIHIRATHPDPAFTALVEGLLPTGATFVVEPADYTYADLAALRLNMEADFNSLRTDFGAKHLGVDPKANRVEVGIYPYSDSVAAALVARYGLEVRVVASEP